MTWEKIQVGEYTKNAIDSFRYPNFIESLGGEVSIKISATYRYFRFVARKFIYNGGINSTWHTNPIREIDIYDENGANIKANAISVTGSHSGYPSNGYKIVNVYDDNYDNYYNPNVGSVTSSYDLHHIYEFDSEKDIRSINIFGHGIVNSCYGPFHYYILGSNDGKEWTVLDLNYIENAISTCQYEY